MRWVSLKSLRPAVVMLITLMAAANAGVVLAAEPALTLKVVPDRESALYEVGEEAAFLITVSRDNERVTDGSVSFVVDDFLTSGKAAGLPEGKVSLGDVPAKIVVKGRRPEFLRCQVTYTPPKGQAVRAAAGVGISPEKIGLSLPVPDDFDEFWAEQKRQLAEIALDPKLTAVDNKSDGIESFDVQVQCLGGTPVSGYFSKPSNANPKSLPIVLWVHGAGVRSSSLGNSLKGAQSGFLSMDINAHGSPNGKPAAFYTELSNGALNNYRYAGRENRDTIYFRGMYLRLVRAIDFLTAQPEWDGKTVVVVGHSQGGGQSLVAGGIDDRVTFIAPGVPAICDHSGAAVGRVNGWPKLVPNGADGKPDPVIQKAARYVDAVNFATRCKADAIMSVGFIDSVCPPSSCYAAYNALRGSKSVINEPLMGHAAPKHIQDAFWARILEHAKRAK
ncbi:MAG: acetylxylan esterase [Rhodopirellula sp.]|nr:acetylxylan esterase [Rhodopirellula sp.]